MNCLNYDCLECQWVDDLQRGIDAVYRMLRDRDCDERRCPKHPKGERCCKPVGHEGHCVWAGGD